MKENGSELSMDDTKAEKLSLVGWPDAVCVLGNPSAESVGSPSFTVVLRTPGRVTELVS